MAEPQTSELDHHHDHPRTITYFVNGESQQTDQHKLTVREILARAGFEPTTDWVLSHDAGGHEFTDQDEQLPIHPDERFTATRKAPVQTA